jgi:hypothetical protein
LSIIDEREGLDDWWQIKQHEVWRHLSKHYDENPQEMWDSGGGLVNADTGEPVSSDIRKWDGEQLLEQFAYLKHSVYTYNAHPDVTADTRWKVGTIGTWFRFRFDNIWKLRQVKSEILRRMEYLDYLTKTKKKNLGGMK